MRAEAEHSPFALYYLLNSARVDKLHRQVQGLLSDFQVRCCQHSQNVHHQFLRTGGKTSLSSDVLQVLSQPHFHKLQLPSETAMQRADWAQGRTMTAACDIHSCWAKYRRMSFLPPTIPDYLRSLWWPQPLSASSPGSHPTWKTDPSPLPPSFHPPTCLLSYPSLPPPSTPNLPPSPLSPLPLIHLSMHLHRLYSPTANHPCNVGIFNTEAGHLTDEEEEDRLDSIFNAQSTMKIRPGTLPRLHATWFAMWLWWRKALVLSWQSGRSYFAEQLHIILKMALRGALLRGVKQNKSSSFSSPPACVWAISPLPEELSRGLAHPSGPSGDPAQSAWRCCHSPSQSARCSKSLQPDSANTHTSV